MARWTCCSPVVSPVRGRRPRALGGRGVGPPRSGPTRRLPAAGPGPVVAGGQTLAIDTPTSLDLQRLSTAELRDERDRLRRQLDQAPRDRSRELARASAHREQTAQVLAAHQQPVGRQPADMLRWLRRGFGRWCGSWPGSDGPPAWRSKSTGLAMSWRPSAQCRRRPGAGGPGGRPPPRSNTTGTPTRSPTRIEPSAPSRTTRPSGPLGSGPTRPSIGFVSSSAPPTTPATLSRPASAPARGLFSSVAGQARSGPPANTTRKEHPMASSRPWPFDDEDRPSGSVRPLSQADLQAILAHLGDDPDGLLAGTDAGRAVVAVRARAAVGRRAARPTPGGGACARPSGRPGSGLCPGGSPSSSASAPVGESLAPCWRPGWGWSWAGWPPWRPAWGCGSDPAQTPSPGGAGRRGERRTARLLAALERQGGRSCTTWPSPAAGPILIIW
jgi:hypothetical protein